MLLFVIISSGLQPKKGLRHKRAIYGLILEGIRDHCAKQKWRPKNTFDPFIVYIQSEHLHKNYAQLGMHFLIRMELKVHKSLRIFA